MIALARRLISLTNRTPPRCSPVVSKTCCPAPCAVRSAGRTLLARCGRLSPGTQSALAVAALFALLTLAGSSADVEPQSNPASHAETFPVASQSPAAQRKP